MLPRRHRISGRPSSRRAWVLVGLAIAALGTSTLPMRAADQRGPTVAAASTPNPVERPRLAPTADHVARELLQIQQQLGGSIVDKSPELAALPVRGRTAAAAPATGVAAVTPAGRAATAVDRLRQASWQLETSAHHLELCELYDQADALRQLAAQLRQDARARVSAK